MLSEPGHTPACGSRKNPCTQREGNIMSEGYRRECLWFCCVLALMGWPVAGRGADWRPAKAPLMTRWAKDIHPDRTHPEYPRPQMTRERWMNLNGIWQF